MNDVIRKCVDELAKEAPRLDYVRGMLDTILSMNEAVKPVIGPSGSALIGIAPLTPEDIEQEKMRRATSSMPPVQYE